MLPCWFSSVTSLYFICLSIASRRIFHLSWHWQVRLTGWYFLGSSFSPFLKMGVILHFSPVIRDFTWLPWLFKYHWEWFGDYVSWFPQDSGMHLIRTQQDLWMFKFLRWSWTWSLLTVGCGFPSALLPNQTSEGCVVSCYQRKRRQEICWVPQSSPCLLLPACLCHSLGEVHPSGVSFSGWGTCKKPFLFFLAPLAKFSSSWAFAFLTLSLHSLAA